MASFTPDYTHAVAYNPAIKWYGKLAKLLRPEQFALVNGALNLAMPPELYRKVMEDTTRERKEAPGNWDFRIERDGGDYIVSQRFVPMLPGSGDTAERNDVAEQLAKDLAKGVTKALFANNHVILRVHGPGIGETNGTVNEKKDTVEWKLALAELLDVPKEGREFRAVVHGGEPLWLWPVVIGVPLAVLGLAISAARKRRAFAGR